ncbi:hypothetical protein N2152v2_006955 [Parachlorella kessleri]
MDPNDPSFGSKEGACGYGVIPKDKYPYFSVAALSPNNSFYKNGPLNGCGECFQIQCVSGIFDGLEGICYKDSQGKPKSILVMISDVCPECQDYHIDVQSLSFAKLTNPDYGRINVNYRRIECTPPEDMKVSVMDFVGNNRWLRITIDDTGGRGSVTQVYVRTSGAKDWTPMVNKWGAAWELGQAPSPPLDFKVTTDDGSEVTAERVIKQNGGISQGSEAPRIKFATGVQFNITDPALQLVKGYSGPDDSYDPMVATSDTPGNSPAPAVEGQGPAPPTAAPPTAGSRASSCVDVSAPGQYSCEQLKFLGRCNATELVQGGFCARTCNRCTSQAAAPSALHLQGPTTVVAAATPEAMAPITPVPAAAIAPAALDAAPSAEPVAKTTVPAMLPAASPATEGEMLSPKQPADSAAGAVPAGGAVTCTDLPPPGPYTCAQQKAWGKCSTPYLAGYCAATCGRCDRGTPKPSSSESFPAQPTSEPGPGVPVASAVPPVPAAERFQSPPPPSLVASAAPPLAEPAKSSRKIPPAPAAEAQAGRLETVAASKPLPLPPTSEEVGQVAGVAPVGEPVATGSRSPSAGAGICADVAPPGPYTCAQQKGNIALQAWGKCQQGFLTGSGYCLATCGACKAQPAVQAFGGEPSSGRKLLEVL